MYEQSFNPFANNLKLVKDYFKSGTVLAIAVVKVVTAVLSAATVILSPYLVNDFLGSMPSIFAELDLPSEIGDTLNSALTESAAGGITSFIPSLGTSVLVIAAFFIIYFKSKNDSPESSPKAGVTILYVLSVISMVIVIISTVGAALAIIAVFVGIIVIGNGGVEIEPLTYSDPASGVQYEIAPDSTVLTVFAIILSIIAVIVMFLMLLYIVSQKRYYGSIKNSMSTYELQNKGAKTYGVMSAIMAVMTGISLLSLPTSFISLGLGEISGEKIAALIVSSLVQISAFVDIFLEAKLALGYNKYINEIKFGYGSHMAPPAAPYAPYPAGGYGAPQYPADQNSYNANVGTDNPYSDPYGSQPAQKPTRGASPVCPNCGAQVDTSAPFCGNCGSKL